MARKAREKSSTGNYAVVLKCIDEIFKSKKVKNMFIECAQQYLGDGLRGIRVSSGMAEMLIHESGKGISMDMKPLMTSFARAYNREFENEGKIFADRFKSTPVEDEAAYENCIKYLENGKSSSLFNGEKKKAATEVKKAPSKPEKKTVRKTATKKAEERAAKPEKKTAPKTEKKAEKTATAKTTNPPEKTEEKPKPKKNDLPVWLL